MYIVMCIITLVIYIYIYLYICVYTHVYVYIYIYIERERECVCVCVCVIMSYKSGCCHLCQRSRPLRGGGRRPGTAVGEGQMGPALMGSLQISCILTEGICNGVTALLFFSRGGPFGYSRYLFFSTEGPFGYSHYLICPQPRRAAARVAQHLARLPGLHRYEMIQCMFITYTNVINMSFHHV